MNRRKFLQFLGIGAPAAAIAVVVAPKLMEPKVVEAKLGEWHNYHSEGDPEIAEAIENWKSYPVHHTANLYYDREMVQRLKIESPKLFSSLASRNEIQIGAPVKRTFFQYDVKL